MTVPKRIPTRHHTEMALAAVSFAVSVLQDEHVRSRLRRAPDAARDWAERHRVERDTEGRDPSDSLLRRVDPTARFGRRGLDRRLGAMRRNVGLAFAHRGADEAFADPQAAAVLDAVEALARAVVIASSMPLSRRTRAYHRISGELAALELALVDAVLPASA